MEGDIKVFIMDRSKKRFHINGELAQIAKKLKNTNTKFEYRRLKRELEKAKELFKLHLKVNRGIDVL